MLNSDTENEKRKPQDARQEAEIVQLKNGEPKVREYCEMVKKELESLKDT